MFKGLWFRYGTAFVFCLTASKTVGKIKNKGNPKNEGNPWFLPSVISK